MFGDFYRLGDNGNIAVSKTEDKGSNPLACAIASWCNGSTFDSDSKNIGSNPVLAVNKKQ